MNWEPLVIQAAVGATLVAVAYGALKTEVRAIHKRVDELHADVQWLIRSLVESRGK